MLTGSRAGIVPGQELAKQFLIITDTLVQLSIFMMPNRQKKKKKKRTFVTLKPFLATLGQQKLKKLKISFIKLWVADLNATRYWKICVEFTSQGDLQTSETGNLFFFFCYSYMLTADSNVCIILIITCKRSNIL